MTSWLGRTIAHYRVNAQIGAGGMGEVYRASDSRLGRDVAIKVLPAEFAADAERMARFEREAKLLASLSHANIASIFGLEEVDGTRALVMELVEGATLAERIAKGALAADDALLIAKQIADALEYAHDRGVIHRDLKPANVKITPDGVVKILDFGLAKALSGDDATASGSDLSRSPTLTAASTKLGVILGTAAYMSPEQAKGRPVDRRADIWAFGAVLMEMLTCRQTFAGETVSETLAAVMKDEPDWAALPVSTPARVNDVIRRCLVKDPRQRLRDIGEARIRIEEEIAGRPDAGVTTPAVAVPARRRATALLVALVAIAAVAAGFYGGRRTNAPVTPPVFRATIVLPEGMELDGDDTRFAISPDGRSVVMAASARGEPQRLWLRRIDRAQATRLEGTDDAAYPFWSPDGRHIGFFAGTKLKRVPADGGAVQNICDVVDGRGGAWGPDGTMVFSPGPLEGLVRVSASGGVPEPVTTLDSTGATHRLPEFLPDGKRVLFVAGSAVTLSKAHIECVDLESKQRVRLFNSESQVRLIGDRKVAYVIDNNLVVQDFDTDALALRGSPVPIAQDVDVNAFRMAGAFDISASGALIWSSRTDVQANQPTWFDLDGRELGKLGEPGTALQASFSKDGRRLVTCERTDNFELWMTDVATGVRTRFSFGEAPAAFPCWSPDMRTVYFATGAGTVLMQASDGATPAKVVLERKGASVWPESATPDGSALLCAHQRTQSVVDIVLLPLDGRGEFKDVIGGPGNQASTAFSPDGRWLAYETDESGRNEVVVVRYPSLEGRWQLSSQGGHNPQWHPDGRSVIYRTPDSHVVRVAVDARGDGLVIGGSTTIFGGKALPGIFDLSPDGRLLVFVPQGTGSAQGLNLVTDWRGLVDERD